MKIRKICQKPSVGNITEALPVYPLGDIRDYLILLGFLFDMDLEDIYSEGLHEQVSEKQVRTGAKSHLKKRYMTLSV